jgi:hypothetical protein
VEKRIAVDIKFDSAAGGFRAYDKESGKIVEQYSALRFGETEEAKAGTGDDAETSEKTLNEDRTVNVTAVVPGYVTVQDDNETEKVPE